MEEGKTIEIRRHYNLIESAQQTDKAVKEWFDASWRAIGPYWERSAKASASGLTWEEKKLLMPSLHTVEPEDRDFRDATNKYFEEILTSIPAEGRILQIGLEDNDKPLSKSNMPVDPKEYVIYRHLINHPDVAVSEQEAHSLPHKKFYIFDKDATTDTQVSINALEDKATEIYFEIRGSEEKVDQVLTLMGIKTKKLTSEEMVLKLKEFSRVDPNRDASAQKKALDVFIKTATSKDLDLEYMITELLGAQILERVGTSILIKETGESLGDSMKESVVFLKNAKNTKVLNYLKNAGKQLIKKKVKAVK